LSLRVVLASQSAARRAVLAGAGVPFEAVVSGVDEEALKAKLSPSGAGVREIAERLADAKAAAVAADRGDLVIGADQTLELDGALYDKVATLEDAAERLRLLRGRTHQLHSAVVAVQDGAPVWRETSSAALTMRPFSDAFLARYLADEGAEVLGSVGCYRLEGPGAQLFERIEGDYFAILGLPLLGLLGLLRERGVLTA
jgi:septum formation protein